MSQPLRRGAAMSPVVKTIMKALEDQKLLPPIVPPAYRQRAYETWSYEVYAALAADGHLQPVERR